MHSPSLTKVTEDWWILTDVGTSTIVQGDTRGKLSTLLITRGCQQRLELRVMWHGAVLLP